MTAPAASPATEGLPETTAEQAVRLAEDYAAGLLESNEYFARMEQLAQVAIEQELHRIPV
jgi:hypothetical protein